MSEVIAEGLVVIKAKQDVDREIAAAKAAFERGMRDMDRKRATMTLDANLAPLQKKLENAERKVEDYRRKVEEDAELGLDTKAAERNLKKWERELAKRRSARDEVSLSTEKARKQLAALQKMEDDRAELGRKYRAAQIKGSEKIAAARQKEADSAVKANAREVAAAQRAAKQKAAAYARDAQAKERAAQRAATAEERAANKAAAAVARAAEKEARDVAKSQARMARDRDKAELAREKEIAAIPTMNRQYAELERRITRLNRERTKLSRDKQSRVVVQLQIEEALAKMEDLKRRLNEVGQNPPVEVAISPGTDFGNELRTVVTRHVNDRRLGAAAAQGGLLIGTAMATSIGRGLAGRNRAILSGVVGMMAKLGHGISTMTVRIGPFTATIRQALVGLSLLGPTVLDLVGGLGALAGVAGSAALGVGALGAAFLGGAIPAALGMGLVIKDVAQEFTAAKKATKAYDDAVMKHGKGSDQAAKKMKELRNVMGAVSETTAKQFVEGQKLGATWDKLTKPAHASVWKMIGNSMEMASNIMPMFARNTNKAMDTAEKGTSKWMKALASPAGQKVLDTLMVSFNRMLGPMMSGLGNLVAYFGKVGAAASTHLEPLANTFDKWAQKLNNSANAGDAFQKKISNIVQSAKDVGNFFLAAGRFIKTFFGAGVRDGQSFVRTMTDGLNRWTAFLNTTEGRNGLSAFFHEAVAGTKALWNTLAPIASSFVRWAAMIAPFARAFLSAAAAVGDLVAGFLRLTALQGPLTALAATLGVLWGVSKISSATRMIGNFGRALFGLGAANGAAAASARGVVAANTAIAASSTRATAALTRQAAMSVTAARAGSATAGLGGVMVAGGAAAAAARAAGPVTKLAKAGGIASKVMRGLGLATLGIASPLAGAAVLAGAAGFAIYKFSTRTRDYEKAAKNAAVASRNFGVASQQMGGIQNQLAQDYLNTKSAALQVKEAERAVATLRRQGETNTDEYRQAVLNLNQAELNLASTRQASVSTTQQEIANFRKIGSEAKTALKSATAYVEGLGKRSNTKRLFESMSAGAQRAGQSLKQYLAGADFLAGNQKKRILEYASALSKQEAAEYRVRRAQELSGLATLNHQRALRGMATIANNAAGHFARISKQSKSLARTIAVKYTDSGSAARVARAASSALKGNVPKQVVTRIIADTKTADGAIARLRGKLAGVNAQRAAVKIGASDQASATIGKIVSRVNGIKDKTARVKARDEAVPTIARIITKIQGVNDKTARIIAKDLASGPARAAQAAINGVQGKTVRIIMETLRIERVRRQGGVDMRNKAVGQKAGSPPGAALIGEGRADEWRVNRRTGMVSKTAGPQVTRLSRDDAIIPTEPRYKARGREIFKEIAKDLGLRMFAKGKAPPKKPTPKKKPPVAADGFNKKGEYSPSKTIPRAPTFKAKSKAGRTPYTSKRGWAEYIETLQAQKGEWEREVSIRESQVKEPENMVIISGHTPVTDPATGEVTQVPQYAPNTAGIEAWKAQLRDVLSAMDTLMNIVRHLVAMIPQAIAANRQERQYRDRAADTLDGQIRAENRRKKPRSERLSRLREDRDEHREQIKTLKGDEKQLLADRVDSGFDLREYAIARAGIQEEHDKASGNAEAEAAASNADSAREIASITSDSSGGGGGGGGDAGGGAAAEPQISYGAQAMIRDTERANVMREHGGNAYMTSPGTAGGGGVPGGGMMTNAATRGYMMGPTAGGGGMASTLAQGGFSEPASFGASGPFGGQAASGGGDKTVNIVNNFQVGPDDPHLFSQGMAFEAQSAF